MKESVPRIGLRIGAYEMGRQDRLAGRRRRKRPAAVSQREWFYYRLGWRDTHASLSRLPQLELELFPAARRRGRAARGDVANGTANGDGNQ